ncbi:MAG: protein adenylyltransferase SelO family protein, partial [Mycobacterium sp.]
HGVMNTDNMTIAGETIDYGPCAFMEAYDPEAVFSSIDSWGRYAYGAQPSIAGWNLARFAETLLPLIADDQDHAVELAQESLARFGVRLQAALASGVRAKLGLADDFDEDEDEDEDGAKDVATPLMNDALALLAESHVDFTSFFRNLGRAARGDTEPARGMFMNLAGFDEWLVRWRSLSPDPEGMDRANPVYIPRNHLVEETLSAATDGDLTPLEKLLEAISAPYDERHGLQRYSEPAPEDFGKYRTFCGT